MLRQVRKIFEETGLVLTKTTANKNDVVSIERLRRQCLRNLWRAVLAGRQFVTQRLTNWPKIKKPTRQVGNHYRW